MANPNCYPGRVGYGCPPSCKPTDECPNHPDLCLLRDAAADERGAIADYLTCAAETCLDELFLDVAEDEMQHYAETMRLISLFDPIQAEKLEEEDLGFLVMNRPHGKPKWADEKKASKEADVEIPPPHKRDLPTIRCLTKALQGELHAINKYQCYMNEAEDRRVKEHFCELMNEEKEHVAEFTAALFTLTHEPLPAETD